MNKFCILLTCCVAPLYCNEKEVKKRKRLYLRVIRKWLKETAFEIYCVDSSGYLFSEINDKRFHIYSFVYKNKDINIGKTHGEVKSILKAYKHFKKEWSQNEKKGYTHVIKITGRYYLEDLEKWCKKKNIIHSTRDLWTQRECLPFPQSLAYYFLSHTNSEIFICRISKLYNMFSRKEKDIYMERHINMLEEKYKYGKLPRLKNTLRSRRGGDNLFLEYL